MRFDFATGVRRGGVQVPFCDEIVGGDQARRELRRSCEEGRGMLRIISRDWRHRIWRRAPERQAMCVAVGDGRESEVAGVVSNLGILNEGIECAYF